MEHFTVYGEWWLPDKPARVVAGILTFDGDGLELVLRYRLHGPVLEAPATPQGWRVEPVVHGRALDGEIFTLLEVGDANLAGPLELDRAVYWPEFALAGCHTEADAFAKAWCSFDYLELWADPPSVIVEAGDPDLVQVRTAARDLARADVDGATVSLVSGAEGSSGSQNARLSRWTSFRVEPAEPSDGKALISSYVRPLQDLLMFCLGRPVRLTSLRLLPVDLPDRQQEPAKTYFSAVQQTGRQELALSAVVSASSSTLLSMHSSPLSLDQLLVRWFGLWTARSEVLSLLLAPLYAPFMYSEHSFGLAFQSAEALHDLAEPTRDVPKAEHAKRVAAVAGALEDAELDADVAAWATKLLQSRNDKPLARKIEDLARSAGGVGVAVLRADAAIGTTAAAARSGVSHGGADKKLTLVERHWYGQVLQWVVRARLLADLLGDAEEAQRRVLGRDPFHRALKEITST